MSTYDDEDYESFELDDAKDDRVPDREDDDSDDPSDDDLHENDDEDDGDEDDDSDDLEDVGEDEIDFVVALYREDGQPVATALDLDLANDLDELVAQLRRLPGDGGVIGMVSIDEDFFVIARVRGQHIQVLLSDGSAANDYPIARDVADFLGIVDLPDEDDEPEPMGDLDILTDLGVSSFDLGMLCDMDDDSSPEQELGELADRLKVGRQFRRVLENDFDL